MCRRALIHVLLSIGLIVLFGAVASTEAQTGQTCGGIAALKCPEGQACQFPANQCNVADLAGTCVPVPETCPKQGPPICGCDGVTYANECELLKAGARPDRQGACKGGQSKSCKSNADCTGQNEFCEFKAGTCSEKGAGKCMVKPEICTQIFQPVCGCDNKTYPNDCFRSQAGVSLKATGECPAGQ